MPSEVSLQVYYIDVQDTRDLRSWLFSSRDPWLSIGGRGSFQISSIYSLNHDPLPRICHDLSLLLATYFMFMLIQF